MLSQSKRFLFLFRTLFLITTLFTHILNADDTKNDCEKIYFDLVIQGDNLVLGSALISKTQNQTALLTLAPKSQVQKKMGFIYAEEFPPALKTILTANENTVFCQKDYLQIFKVNGIMESLNKKQDQLSVKADRPLTLNKKIYLIDLDNLYTLNKVIDQNKPKNYSQYLIQASYANLKNLTDSKSNNLAFTLGYIKKFEAFINSGLLISYDTLSPPTSTTTTTKYKPLVSIGIALNKDFTNLGSKRILLSGDVQAFVDYNFSYKMNLGLNLGYKLTRSEYLNFITGVSFIRYNKDFHDSLNGSYMGLQYILTTK